MSTILLPPSTPSGFDVPPLSVRRFTVDEYEQLGKAGVLSEDDSVELLEGLIVKKTTKNPLHDSTIDLLVSILSRKMPAGWFLRIQNVLRTADSEPEPDVVIAIGNLASFRRRHPTGDEVALVIEVAQSSLEQDWRKCRIYARAGVIEYWIVDLNAARLEIFTQPNRASGKYENHVRRVAPGEVTVNLSSETQVTVDLQELFPSAGE
jgi:Uma2 family endonuclease